MNIQSRYGIALFLLFFAYLIQGMDRPVVQILVDVTFIVLLVIVLLDPQSPRWAKISGGIIIAISAASSMAYGSSQNPELGTFSFALNAIVLGLSVILVMRRLSKQDVVTLSTVLGAILAYALFAFMCASVFNAVDLATSLTFFSEPGIVPGDYVYFSFVTLTTLGFGDLTPATDLAKRLVVMEAFIGQVFLVVLVARLVSLWGHVRPTTQEASP
jgi:voltage-gated potassium channel